jgi:signal transduction histidine kinase
MLKDDGRGISIVDRIAVFDPQVRARNADAATGSGLG